MNARLECDILFHCGLTNATIRIFRNLVHDFWITFPFGSEDSVNLEAFSPISLQRRAIVLPLLKKLISKRICQ